VNIPVPSRVSLTGRTPGPIMPTRLSNLRVSHSLALSHEGPVLRFLGVGSYDLTSPTLFSCFSRARLPKRPAPTSNNFSHSISEAIP
jgi:hypothetical protein